MPQSFETIWTTIQHRPLGFLLAVARDTTRSDSLRLKAAMAALDMLPTEDHAHVVGRHDTLTPPPLSKL